MNEMGNVDEDGEIYDDVVILKRKTSVFGGRKRRTIMHVRTPDEDIPVYGNVPQ